MVKWDHAANTFKNFQGDGFEIAMAALGVIALPSIAKTFPPAFVCTQTGVF
jgi:hypothetical protein